MIFKLTGILFIVSACGIAGILKSKELYSRVRFCDNLIVFFQHFSALIRCSSYNLEEIIHCLDNDNLSFIKYYFTIDDSFCFYDKWKKSVIENVYLSEEKEILLSVGKELGTTDIEGQTKLISYTIERLTQLRKTHSENYNRLGKVYRSTGFLFGFMLGIVII